MEVFLTKDGLIVNVVVVESLQQARDLYPEFTPIERTPLNNILNQGDTYHD